MRSDTKPPIRRVMSSNGRVWQTNAQGAADYLFSPVFMTFFILCVVLYATLMQPSEETSLPIPAQMVLWGGLIMTSLLWLFISVWLSVQAFDRGVVKAIYTPLILLPLVIINTFMGEFVLSVFSQDFQGSYGTMLENVVQNAIILVTFDIMHERFVVPQHPRHVSGRGPMANVGSLSAPADPDDRSAITSPPPAVATAPVPDARLAQSPGSVADCPEPQNFIKISNERIDPTAILWVKSEDHYVSIQMKHRSVMVRGKLRTIVGELGDELGAQVNRSAWVAFTAIRGLDETANGVLEVSLADDSVHRIANSRRLVFKQNYERFQASMAPTEDDRQAEA